MLLAIAIGWLFRPAGSADGPVLFSLTENHGVHLGDLVPVTLGIIAAWIMTRRR